jgi:hypothetical protein
MRSLPVAHARCRENLEGVGLHILAAGCTRSRSLRMRSLPAARAGCRENLDGVALHAGIVALHAGIVALHALEDGPVSSPVRKFWCGDERR